MRYRFAETDEEILACYPVMSELRQHLVKQEFVSRVRRQQQHGSVWRIWKRGKRSRRSSAFGLPNP